jgi:translation machinery-associated protein 16
MGHAKTVKKPAPGQKEKIFHPQSRKADQIARSNLRKEKMSAAAAKRSKRDAQQGKYPLFLCLNLKLKRLRDG